MNNRVLITGANGYIGSHVVAEFLRRGFQVVANDIVFDHVPEGAEKLVGNVFDPEFDLYELSGKPDYLVHLVWRNGFQHNAPTHLQDLPQHVDFLDRMIQEGVSHISVMGSMHEIGYHEGPIQNDTPANPQSYYGIAKNALRQAAELLTKGKDISFCWLRGFYLYGDDERNHSVLAKLLQAEKEGKEFFPFTSGKNLYDFIHVDEFARQIAAATVQSEIRGTVNCCSGEPISLGDMAEKFIREKGLGIKLQYGAFPDRPYDSPGVWGDASLIRQIMKNEEK
jgi:dTDP-6-deoxy-L-talose 4-dehydrogenase (NAD+)